MQYNDTLTFLMFKWNQEKKHWFQENRVQEITQHEIYINQDIHSQIINGQEIGRPDTRQLPFENVKIGIKGTLHFRNNLGSKDSLDPSE